MTAITFVPDGTSASPTGFRAGATYAGIKTYGDGKLDLAILVSDRDCDVAATFTRNRLRSAAIDVNEERLTAGHWTGRGVVVNAGCANSSTGEQGLVDGRRMCELAEDAAGAPAGSFFVGSTGVIGHFLPMDKIAAGVRNVRPTREGGMDFARAIMTTDLRPKFGAVRFGPYTLGGSCKGSGMIHPNMATMLCYLTTDAPVEAAFLRSTLSAAVDRTFNLVSVDGDTSPSDTVMLFANGAAGGETITAGTDMALAFAEAVEVLCTHLAKEIARDGEGATKLLEVTITGAASDTEARQLVREMTTSYLLKSAVHGADPNWGRIVAVIGRSTVRITEPKVTVTLCGTRVFEAGRPTDHDPAAVAEAMHGDTVTITCDLGVGEGSATGWGCDLSAEYVSINADYHT
ncbi:MAG: bifunctional glutamate N-acetyltransferase/amino-acid acetyltransferase ArgJ [Dehalococcoidia bacterium]|nr:bifunctional glutamate N-acetyltransferase/amino-acid acetyltransferase ArgJ [Dehalococcoidia bacterium]